MFVVKFFVRILPLFIARDLAAYFLYNHPKAWHRFEKYSRSIWRYYNKFCKFLFSSIDKRFGEESKFESFDNAIPWKRFKRVLVSVKEDFDRNKLLAMLDLVYPISTLCKINDNERANIRLQYKDNLWHECKYAVQYATYIYFSDFLGMPKNFDSRHYYEFTPNMLTGDTFDAGYFIAIDKSIENNEKLLLCIRGSSSFGDFGVDIDATPTKMIHLKHLNKGSYYVHRGIWKATECMHARVTDRIIELFHHYKKKYPNLKIVVTGHSLGAGVCSLLGIMWYYGIMGDTCKYSTTDPEHGIKNNFSCYSFASPPVIDENGRKLVQKEMIDPKTGRNIITSIANQSDIVTRMSIPGLVDACSKIDHIGKHVKNYEIINNIVNKRCQCLEDNSDFIVNNSYISDDGTTFTFENEKNETKYMIDVSKLEKEEYEFIDKFIKFKYNHNNDPCLYPCGLVVWRIPQFKWNDLQHSYRTLRKHIHDEDLGWRIWQCTHRMLVDIFGDIDKFGNFSNGGNQYELYKLDGSNVLNNFDIFSHMVINTGVAVMDHAQGQYSATFGMNLIHIFKLSNYYWVKWLPNQYDLIGIKIVKCIIAILLCVINLTIVNIVGIFQ